MALANAGCAPGAFPSVSATVVPRVTPAQKALLDQIPPDLRVSELRVSSSDEASRYRRLAEAYRNARFDPPPPSVRRRVRPSLWQRMTLYPATITEPGLERVRAILREGPVRPGPMDPHGDPELMKSQSLLGFTMPNELIASGARLLSEGKIDQGVEDLSLSGNYLRSQQPIFLANGKDMAFLEIVTCIEEGLTRKLFSSPQRQRLLQTLPTPESLTEWKVQEVKQALHDRVLELAKMKAPRTDFVIEGPRESGRTPDPRLTVKVPSHGTLDRGATLKLLIEIARLDLQNARRVDGGFSPRAVQRVKEIRHGLPEIDHMTLDPASVAEVKKQIGPYVKGMNSQSNSLGREMIWAMEESSFRYDGKLIDRYARAIRALKEQP